MFDTASSLSLALPLRPGLVRRSHGSRLKLRDRTHDSHPNKPSVQVASFQKFIGPVRRNDFCIITVLTNQQINRSPHIKL